MTPLVVKCHVSLVMFTKGLKPFTAFLVRALPPIGAGAGRRLADNLAKFFRHLDKRKLNKRHTDSLIQKMQLSTINYNYVFKHHPIGLAGILPHGCGLIELIAPAQNPGAPS